MFYLLQDICKLKQALRPNRRCELQILQADRRPHDRKNLNYS